MGSGAENDSKNTQLLHEHTAWPEHKTSSICMAQDELWEEMLGNHGKKSLVTNTADC